MAVYLDESVPLRPITVADYFRMGEVGLIGEDERTELLRGVIVEMSPPSEEHDDVIQWLNMFLVPLVKDAGLQLRVQSAIVFESANSVPMPDLIILERRDRKLRQHPTTACIAIESSVSSLRMDTRLKAGLYAEQGIPEYWVIDVLARRVLRHTEPTAEGYGVVEVLDDTATLQSSVVPTLAPISVAEIFDGDL